MVATSKLIWFRGIMNMMLIDFALPQVSRLPHDEVVLSDHTNAFRVPPIINLKPEYI